MAKLGRWISHKRGKLLVLTIHGPDCSWALAWIEKRSKELTKPFPNCNYKLTVPLSEALVHGPEPKNHYYESLAEAKKDGEETASLMVQDVLEHIGRHLLR